MILYVFAESLEGGLRLTFGSVRIKHKSHSKPWRASLSLNISQGGYRNEWKNMWKHSLKEMKFLTCFSDAFHMPLTGQMLRVYEIFYWNKSKRSLPLRVPEYTQVCIGFVEQPCTKITITYIKKDPFLFYLSLQSGEGNNIPVCMRLRGHSKKDFSRQNMIRFDTRISGWVT